MDIATIEKRNDGKFTIEVKGAGIKPLTFVVDDVMISQSAADKLFNQSLPLEEERDAGQKRIPN